MQGDNRFLNFAEQVIARHRGFGQGFAPAAMLYLTDQPQEAPDQAVPQSQFTTNLYHIQNIREENYLFRQNLTFLTQILENKIYHNLYPSVEKQIEKTIREELPQAEKKTAALVSQQLCRLIQQGGIEQFETLKTQILSEHQETENILLREQETLLRRIENIWNSSIYREQIHTSRTDTENHTAVFHHRELLPGQTERIVNDHTQTVKDQTVVTDRRELMLQYADTVTEDHETRISDHETLIRNHEKIWNEREEALKKSKTVVQDHETKVLNRETVRNDRETILQKHTIVQPELLQRAPGIVKPDEGRQPQSKKETHEGIAHDLVYLEEPQPPETETVITQPTKERQVVQQEQPERILTEHQKELHSKEILERTLAQIETQSALFHHSKKQTIRETMLRTEQEQHLQMLHQREVRKETVLKKEHSTIPIKLEYPSEETTQLQQEIIEVLHTQLQQAPEIPKLVLEAQQAAAAQGTTHSPNASLQERTKTISEQILTQMEQTGILPVTQGKTVQKTVVFNQLSHAIMEYAQSETTTEQLEQTMLQILEKHRTAVIAQKGTDSVQTVYEQGFEQMLTVPAKSPAKQRFLQRIQATSEEIPSREHAPILRSMELAPIVYRPEETAAPEQQQKTKQLEMKVNEVVKTIQKVEEKTIVQREQITEQQKEVVQEVLRSNAKLLIEGENGSYLRNEVQQSVEEQIDQSVNQIANRVYRRLEERLKSERGRRGLI